MKITDIKTERITVPLKAPFRTALRTAAFLEEIAVILHTDEGVFGYGGAAPSGVITGETAGSILYAVEGPLKSAVAGMSIEDLEEIFERLDRAIAGNPSAKAAVDIALYDLFCKRWDLPLYRLLGGTKKILYTDITVSADEPERMGEAAARAVAEGYRTLKIKVCGDRAKDILRIKRVREAAGPETALRIDANQSWAPKEAVITLREIEDLGLNIELAEQPVAARDIDGLKYVTDRVSIPILADESVFTPRDALEILEKRAADLINIKLMKCGGIHQALRMIALCEGYGVKCMMGCMLEGSVSVTAAAHFAMSKSVVTKIDLDSPALLRENSVIGGISFDRGAISAEEGAGLGIRRLRSGKG